MSFVIKAKKAIKKVSALAVGAAMIGSTMFGAVAATTLADYPSPFVKDGVWNTVIVVGADAAPSDVTGAIDVAATLSQQATTAYTGSSTTTTTVEGGVSLNSGSNKLWLNSELDDNVDVITKDDFPTLLADGKFEDESGSTTDYTQKIEPGRASFDYSTSNNDLDDPALIIQAGDDASTATERYFSYTLTFESPIDFTNSTNVQGQTLNILGKDYTIGTDSDSDTIELLGGSMDVTLNWGETKTVTFDGEDYEITLNGIESTGNKASITINGETKSISEDATKTIGGVDIYADTLNYYGLDAYPGDATISLGSQELWLEDGSAVMTGSDKDDIDGTYVDISYTGDFSQVSGITISFAASDSDVDDLEPGDSYTDPVFGKVKTTFADVVTGETKTIKTVSEGDEEVWVSLTDVNGNEKTVPFTYNKTLATSDNEDIIVNEYGALTDEDYFILNDNDNQHFMQVKKIDIDDDTGIDKVEIRDVFTGTTYTEDSKDLDSTNGTITINGKDYKIQKVTPSSIRITQGSSYSIYPYMELWKDKTTRIAWTDNLSDALDDPDGTNDTAGDGEYLTVDLPTGQILLDSYSNGTDDAAFAYKRVGTDSIWQNGTANDANSIQVGTVYYIITHDSTDGTFDFALDEDQDGSTTDDPIEESALLIVEEENNKHSDSKYALILKAEDGSSGSYTEVDADNAIWTYDSADTPELLPFDNTDYKATYDDFGTYLYEDASDSDQSLVEVTIPKEQMYANVYISPAEATTTTTTTSGEGVTVNTVSGVDVAKLDTEITDKTAKPMILVGGPAINRLTAEVAGLAYPTYGADSAAEFGYSEGKAVLKLYENAFGGDNVALVVAGWSADDTRRACKVLKDFADYDLTGDHLIITGTQTTPVVEPYVEPTADNTAEDTNTEDNTTE